MLGLNCKAKVVWVTNMGCWGGVLNLRPPTPPGSAPGYSSLQTGRLCIAVLRMLFMHLGTPLQVRPKVQFVVKALVNKQCGASGQTSPQVWSYHCLPRRTAVAIHGGCATQGIRYSSLFVVWNHDKRINYNTTMCSPVFYSLLYSVNQSDFNLFQRES